MIANLKKFSADYQAEIDDKDAKYLKERDERNAFISNK